MQHSGKVVTVKKYSNRRLYDTSDSRYITLDELAQKIRSGKDVRVIDAKSNEDLTQQTLTQIILESRRAVLYVGGGSEGDDGTFSSSYRFVARPWPQAPA